MEHEAEPVRRRVLDFLLASGLGGVAAVVLYPVLRFLAPPQLEEHNPGSVVAGSLSDFPPNSGKVIRFGRAPAIVVRTPAGEFRAFSAVCTHLQCTVQYRSDLRAIWCACHNGRYDLHGRNVSGPPPRPLDRLAVAVRGDKVIVSRKA